MPFWRKNDGAHTYVLEVIIVALMMTSAVTFVVTFQAAPVASTHTRALLEQHAHDMLAILYDSSRADGTNHLSALILDCLQGDCAEFERAAERLLPKGTQYALYISTGNDVFPVHELRRPPAESVTARRLIEPAWSHTFLATGITTVNPNEDALVVYALPIHKSNPIVQGGSPLLVRVHGTRLADSAAYVITGAYATQAHHVSDASRSSAVSLFFSDAAGQPMATTDLSAKTRLFGVPTLEPVRLTLRLVESAGVAVPQNASVTVRVPAGWTATAPADQNMGWNVLANATDKSGAHAGSEIQARLKAPLAGAGLDLVIDAVYRGDVIDYYPFHASLSRGATATASLLVRADEHGTQPALELPGLYLSVPRPMGATATTTWTLAAAIPDPGGFGDTNAVFVDRIEILEGNGDAVFGSVAAISTDTGHWASEGDRLVWTGAHLLAHGNPLNLSFAVTASGIAGEKASEASFLPPITFDGWTGRIVTEMAPGFFRGAFLPAGGGYDGYNGHVGLALHKAHPISSDGVYRTTPLSGSGTYTVGHFTGMRDALYGSYIGFGTRSTTSGTQLDIEVHVQSLLYGLAHLGHQPTVTLRVHPPWADGTATPIHTEVLFDGGTLLPGTLLNLLDINNDGALDATSHGLYAVPLQVPSNWLFGAYVVEVELDWGEAVAALVGGVPFMETLTRTAHVYDYFMVVPPSGLVPPTPIYDVHLVAWLEDWS